MRMTCPVRLAAIQRWRARLGHTGRVAAVLALLFGGYLGWLQLSGNFHEVLPGELYRSAQPDTAAIESAAAMGVKTIINLRGAKPGEPWYDAEVAAAERLGLTLVDFQMSPRQALDQERAIELIALMKGAEKPLLIHCKAGADRTGLASALYLAATSRVTEAEAETQLTPYYGHIPLSILPEYAMDETFEAMEPWLGYSDS